MIFDNMAETEREVRIERPEEEGSKNKGEEEEAWTAANRDLIADTGHRGEREGMWTTWCVLAACMAFPHLSMMWTPRGSKMMSRPSKFLVT